MEGKRIGIVVGGAGAIPEAAIRMAQEHDVELVRVEDISKKSTSQPVSLNRCTRFILDLKFLTSPCTTHHEWEKVVRNTVVMRKELRRTGRKTRRRKPIDGENKRIIKVT